MRQSKALTDQSTIVALRNKLSDVRTGSHVEERFFVEDGWVFREHHGKYVECICRSDEISSLTETPSQTLLGRV
ncbi:MAG: hypothetical protein KGK02_05570 [Rhodospirillales bacterium]|nr:hypothetical protein [Rhodospirillales bacterium]